MTETATEQTAPADEKAAEPTAEELKAEFATLPEVFRNAIDSVNDEINRHNANVRRVKASEAQNPNQLKHEIYEQTTNPKIKKLYEKELELREQIEKVRAQGYKLVESEGLMPKELSEDEIEKLKSSVSDGVKDLRSKVEAIIKFEEMAPAYKGKFAHHIVSIETRRGTAKSGGNASTGQKRLRFKRITVNGDIADEKGNTVYQTVKNASGEEVDKYTLGFLAKFLGRQANDIHWTQNELQDAYLKGLDEDNLPEEHEFVMTHNYKDAKGNEHSINFPIKAYR